MELELYKKHRPETFKRFLGNEEAVASVIRMLKSGNFPHTTLFTGPSGCGKTTLARIIRTKLKCHDIDFHEMNSADFRGIDMVRDIRARVGLAPVGGLSRVWLIDECHQITKQAQEAFLKLLEDTPKHVYFFLATTDPSKLLPTIRTRATDVKLKLMPDVKMAELVASVSSAEGIQVDEEVTSKIVEFAGGSPRKALVLLHQVRDMPSEDALGLIENSDSQVAAIDLCRLLLNQRTKWPEVAKAVKAIEEEPETVRRIVLGYATNVLLSGGKLAARAYFLIECFRENYFDSGKAGLASSCYEVFSGE